MLAVLLSALLVWRWNALWALASVGAAAAVQWRFPVLAGGARSVAASLEAIGPPALRLGFEIGLACLLLLGLPAIYRATLRLAARSADFRPH